MAVRQAALRVLAQVADELDSEGYQAEANVIDQVTEAIVEDLLEQEGISEQRTVSAAEMFGKASKALGSLDRALTNFLNKNLDSRGDSRRDMNKCVDLAEDLQECIQNILGSNRPSGGD